MTTTIRQFLAKHGFKSYSTPTNSWDSFRKDGTALMQLWASDSAVARDPSQPERYMRVRCWDAQHFGAHGKTSAVGYSGRQKALEHFEAGRRVYVIMSSPPSSMAPGPGVWAPHANLERAYPVLTLERAENGDVFVIVGRPVEMTAL